MFDFCIIVHAGAGYHSKKKESLYNSACLAACQKAADHLRANRNGAVEAAVLAVEVLENQPVTNAGRGSNLTEQGTVECDASVMCGLTKLFGGVGALSGIANPIRGAEKLLVQQQKYPTLSLGRIPPSVLVGQGAYDWCSSAAVPTCTNDHLVTDESVEFYRRCKRKLTAYEKSTTNSGESSSSKRHCRNSSSNSEANMSAAKRLDTVGAVCLDASGNVASAVSSGGIALKSTGRIGQACTFGSGCWADVDPEVGAVGAATSGTGEQLMRTLLAYKSSERLKMGELPVKNLSDSLHMDFLESTFLRNEGCRKCAGIIAIKLTVSGDNSGLADIVYGHTTDSMSVAYSSSSHKKPVSIISRQSDSVSVKNPIVTGGTTVKFCVSK